MKLDLFNEDCMEVMSRYPDGYFDLAIVDPPYGHGNDLIRKGNTRSNIASAGKASPYENGTAPDPEYFIELKRVSKNQIIWGANHFCDRFDASGSAWIAWDKENGKSCFADCELAFSSFGTALRMFKYMWNGMHQGSFGGDTSKNVKRIHPTQKPVPLYDWLLKTYAEKGCRVIDTHLGSGTSAIAAHYFGCSEFVGSEISAEYCSAAKARIERETAQIDMF